MAVTAVEHLDPRRQLRAKRAQQATVRPAPRTCFRRTTPEVSSRFSSQAFSDFSSSLARLLAARDMTCRGRRQGARGVGGEMHGQHGEGGARGQWLLLSTSQAPNFPLNTCRRQLVTAQHAAQPSPPQPRPAQPPPPLPPPPGAPPARPRTRPSRVFMRVCISVSRFWNSESSPTKGLWASCAPPNSSWSYLQAPGRAGRRAQQAVGKRCVGRGAQQPPKPPCIVPARRMCWVHKGLHAPAAAPQLPGSCPPSFPAAAHQSRSAWTSSSSSSRRI